MTIRLSLAGKISIALTIAFGLGNSANAASNVGVFSTGNSQVDTEAVAAWLQASGQFSSVSGFNSKSFSYNQLNSFDEVLFFTNTSSEGMQLSLAICWPVLPTPVSVLL